MYETRKIPPGQLPHVTDAITGERRPATHQDLMNLGLFHAVDDYYAAIGVFDDNRGQHKQGTKLPGQLVSRGLAGKRHREMPRPVKDKLRMSVRFGDSSNDDPPLMRFAGEPD